MLFANVQTICMDNIELVYVPLSGELVHVALRFTAGMNVTDALAQSKLTVLFPELIDCRVGIFSKQVSRDTLLTPGARVEFYRGLSSDPKDKRRQRAS